MTGSKRQRDEAIAMGKRIAAFREKAGLNQSDLAVRLKIKPQSVQQWENGQTQPIIIDGPHRFLKPINPRYPIIELDKHAVICGVVVEHHQFHVPGALYSWLSSE